MLAPFLLMCLSVTLMGLLEAESGLFTWCPLSGLMLCPYEELDESLFLRSELIALDDMVSFLK